MGSAWSRKQATIDASFNAAPRDVTTWDLQHVKILHGKFQVQKKRKKQLYNNVTCHLIEATFLVLWSTKYEHPWIPRPASAAILEV